MELTPSLKLFGEHCRVIAYDEMYECDYMGNVHEESDAHTQMLLKQWHDAKSQHLFKMLDGNLSLSKHINIEMPRNVLEQEMASMCEQQSYFFDKLVTRLREKLGILEYNTWRHENTPEEDAQYEMYDRFIRHLMRDDYLVDNRITCDGHFEIDGKKYAFTKGQKIMRAVKPVAKALGLEEDFEAFRQAHSQVLNVKNLTGELVLSIEPLDYATASDNANGWSSCMSWYEGGCYRAGTIEMMNSQWVLCAYLKSEKNVMKVGRGQEWPSKKWRAWMLIHEDFILCNRHYPYDNEALARIAIDWATELAHEKLGWSYEENITHTSEDSRYIFGTSLMYNDISGNEFVRWGCHTRKGWSKPYMNYSGPSMCINCGAELEDSEASTLLCNECRGDAKCECCGGIIDREDCATGLNGEMLCWDCYDSHYGTCEHCCDVYDRDDLILVRFPVTDKALERMGALPKEHPAKKAVKNHWFWGDSYSYPSSISVNLCENCLRDFGLSMDNIAVEGSKHSYWDSTFTADTPLEKILRIMRITTLSDPAYALYEIAWNTYWEQVNED